SAASRCGRNALDRRDMRRRFGWFGVIETFAQAVHQLLDREQSDKNATDRDRRGEGCNRRHRGESDAGKDGQEGQIVERDEPALHAEQEEARRALHNSSCCASQRVCDRGQIEVIVTPRRDRGASEDRVNEESRGYLLQPQPGPADLARNYVEDDGGAEAE